MSTFGVPPHYNIYSSDPNPRPFLGYYWGTTTVNGYTIVYILDPRSPVIHGGFHPYEPPHGGTVRGTARNDLMKASPYGDTFYGLAGNDRLIGGLKHDVLHGGDGNDVLAGNADYDWLYGERGNDTLIGGAGGDTLTGGDGNDVLRGDAGNDHLSGGHGHDAMWGGGGSDTFTFDTRPNANDVDRIVDFDTKQDRIFLDWHSGPQQALPKTLSASEFWSGSQAHAQDANDRVIYQSDTGWLNYDANGNAPGGEVHIALLAKHLSLTASDFMVLL